MIVHVSASRETQTFAQYVDELLTALGETNSSAARLTGVHVSNISNWRRGASLPTIERARQFADGMRVPRIVVMIKAGLLEPADIHIDPLYFELAELDTLARKLDEQHHRTLRDHVRLLIDGTGRKLERLREAKPGTGRERQAS